MSAERSPLPWAVAGSCDHIAGSVRCAETCGVGQVPVRVEDHRHVMAEMNWVEDIVDATGAHVVCLGGHDYDDCGYVSVPDAEFIVRAVNCHAALLAALKALVENEEINLWVGGNPNVTNRVVQQALDAIAKAEASHGV